ncbi:hypothetical protein GCM10023196_016530 [Actinoallomurus vinaceus]|uniref:Response regulatory domain-containing protein n=1 Tax=Actinoallomurus vinaceus TaxID=1080074 RepID=A0ABP8U6Q0_9ACTN
MAAGILLVDDHPGFRRLTRRLLEAGGLEVVGEAADGREALRRVAALCPGVVVMDVFLPDMDGFAVAERLAASEEPPVVVLISSHCRAELGTRLDRAPITGFLAKDELSVQRLTELLSRR